MFRAQIDFCKQTQLAGITLFPACNIKCCCHSFNIDYISGVVFILFAPLPTVISIHLDLVIAQPILSQKSIFGVYDWVCLLNWFGCDYSYSDGPFLQSQFESFQRNPLQNSHFGRNEKGHYGSL